MASYFASPFGQAQAPPIVVDDDVDMVWVFERFRAANERRIVERPLRRREFPDQLREIVPVFLVARASAIGGEIELIPPLQLRFGRKRRLRGFWLPIR